MKPKRPMRVLLLTRFYAPSPEVGALRPAKLAAALRAAGHEVTVVTATPAAAGPGGESLRDIVRIAPHPSPREWLLRTKALVTGTARTDERSTTSTTTLSSAPAHSGLLARARSLLLSFAWLPDDQQGLILPMVNAVVEAANDRRYDVLVSTAPPFSTHLAALVASTITGIPWVCEFRDPWIYAGSATSDMHPYASAVNRWLERLCLKRSAQVVAVTEQTGALLAARRSALSRPAPVVILNGIDRLESHEAATRIAGPVRVLHAGNLYAGRDPRPFLHAVARLRRAGALPSTGVQVDFVGEAERYDGISMQSLVDDLELTSIVRLRGRIPHQESLAMQHAADVLLLLAQRQPIQVPNKLYEYLGAARPIVAFVDEKGESASMLRRANGHFVVTEDTPDIDSVVRAALEAPINNWRPADRALLETWTTEVQFAHYEALLSQQFGGPA